MATGTHIFGRIDQITKSLFWLRQARKKKKNQNKSNAAVIRPWWAAFDGVCLCESVEGTFRKFLFSVLTGTRTHGHAHSHPGEAQRFQSVMETCVVCLMAVATILPTFNQPISGLVLASRILQLHYTIRCRRKRWFSCACTFFCHETASLIIINFAPNPAVPAAKNQISRKANLNAK